jgi:D-alanine-D-alanine ligase
VHLVAVISIARTTPDQNMLDKPNFFDEGSPYLNHPLLTQERTSREVDFVLSCVDLPEESRLLDIGCGPGRHSIELARRGYAVVGIDTSTAMIKAAQERAVGIHPAPTFLVQRTKDLTSQDPFDAAICLFTTLGQIEDNSDNSRLVIHVVNNLRPGGRLIVEVPQRSWVISNLKTSERFGAGERYTDIVRSYNALDKSLTETFTLVSPHAEHEYLLRYRLFNQTELRSLLNKAGFELIGAYGDYDAVPIGEDSRLMVMVAQKRP